MSANMRHDGSPFDLAVNKVLDDLSHNPSQFVDMLKSECALDYYDVPKGDALDAMVHRAQPKLHESSRKLGDNLFKCWRAYVSGDPQSDIERGIGADIHYFATRFACEQAESDE